MVILADDRAGPYEVVGAVSAGEGGAPHDHAHQKDPEESAEQVWERLYTERGQRWTGRPNQRLVEVAGDLPPGRALDVGCGEGGDAVWLAQRGWAVTAVDVSPVALGRLTAQAGAEGVADRIDTVHIDLATAFPKVPEGGWDLVSAQFFQSTIALPRTTILRRGAAATAPGGLLLVVEHGEGPPWSNHHDVVFPTVEETLAELALPSGDWSPVRVERSTREAEGPDGRRAEFVDNIIALRRV
ncbi:MAG: methyltransferase domain-containing protein [Actinomycetota bacterium]|nr:methyltransferase domain-containing protein [Actinomycetota bacterium]